MRLIALARAAWDAEALYLRRTVRARGFQVAFGGVAALFALLTVAMLHLAAFAALAPAFGPVLAALIVAAVDLVMLVVFALLAVRAGHDELAEEALRVRQAAIRQIGDGAARAAVLAPLLRSQSAKKGLVGAMLTAAVVALMGRR